MVDQKKIGFTRIYKFWNTSVQSSFITISTLKSTNYNSVSYKYTFSTTSGYNDQFYQSLEDSYNRMLLWLGISGRNKDCKYL